MQLIHAQHTVACFQVADDAPMIHDAPFVRAGDVDVPMMPRAVGQFAGFQNDLALGVDLQRTFRRTGADVVGAVDPVALRPHEVVHAVSFQHAGAFHITFRRDGLEDAAVCVRNETVHRVVHNGHIAVLPAAVVQVDGAVVILEKMRINGLGVRADPLYPFQTVISFKK